MKIVKIEFVGWYAVENDVEDWYRPDDEANGPYVTYTEAKNSAKADQIIRYLADDGYLYVDEPDESGTRRTR
jgi:hypothetical protein